MAEFADQIVERRHRPERHIVAIIERDQVRNGCISRFQHRSLTRVAQARRLPRIIQCDQGTEFTSRVLDHWAYAHQVALDVSRRGTPGDNALGEAFNGSVRRECLSQAYLATNTEVQTALDHWRDDYNNHRSHQSLAYLPPAHFRAHGAFTQAAEPPTLRSA